MRTYGGIAAGGEGSTAGGALNRTSSFSQYRGTFHSCSVFPGITVTPRGWGDLLFPDYPACLLHFVRFAWHCLLACYGLGHGGGGGGAGRDNLIFWA